MHLRAYQMSFHVNLDKVWATIFKDPCLYLISISNDRNAILHLIHLADLDIALITYSNGLWSLYTMICIPKTLYMSLYIHCLMYIYEMSIHNFNLFNYQITSKASFSIVDHLIWEFVSLQLAKAMYLSSICAITETTACIATSLLSQYKLVTRFIQSC